jgi:hypothetical protein
LSTKGIWVSEESKVRLDNSYAVDAWKDGGRRRSVGLIPLDEQPKLSKETRVDL